MEAEEKSRQQGEQQEQGDRPVEEEEEADQPGQGQALLDDVLQPPDQLGGAVDGLVLGPVQSVEKFRILVIGEIDLHRLVVELFHDVLLHHGRLMALQPGVDAGGDHLQKDQSPHQRGEQDERGRRGGDRARLQGGGDPVEDQLARI